MSTCTEVIFLFLSNFFKGLQQKKVTTFINCMQRDCFNETTRVMAADRRSTNVYIASYFSWCCMELLNPYFINCVLNFKKLLNYYTGLWIHGTVVPLNKKRDNTAGRK